MKLLGCLVVSLILPVAASAQGGTDAELEAQRRNLWQHYLQPDAHMALAKLHHERGNRLLAFYILEFARRTIFEESAFDAAFARVFRKDAFDNGKEAEEKLKAALSESPGSAEAHRLLADIYVSRSDWAAAERLLREALAMEPDNFVIMTGLAEVLRRDGRSITATQLENEYLRRNPESLGAHRLRVRRGAKAGPGQLKKVLQRALAAYPKDGEFLFSSGVVLQSESDLDGAERSFVMAADAEPMDDHIQGWTGRFFLKVRQGEEEALHYYLNAYFLNPHFYDSEYAESRVRTLNWTAVNRALAAAPATSDAVRQRLRHTNPVMVSQTFEAVAKNWQPGFDEALLALLDHDDEIVRIGAAGLLAQYAPAFDQRLEQLLGDPNLYRRGAAAYIAVRRWKQKGVERIAPWLDSDQPMLRAMATGALLEFGEAAGRAVLEKHRPQETNPILQGWLKSLDKKE